jgi:RNA polymerase sigma-70 factor (ECF subfamily)
MGDVIPASPDPRQEERALVERMLAGDEQAFNDFADGYFPSLYRFALGRLRGDTELCREIVQTTVCKALAKLDKYRGEAALLTWLCACCRNEIAMYFRKKKSSPRELELDEGIAVDAFAANTPGIEDPESDLIRRQAARFVHLALDLLPPHYAQALEWKYLDRLSVREIGQRLQMGPKAAESLLTRARSAFRRDYERLTNSLAPGELAAASGGKEVATL